MLIRIATGMGLLSAAIILSEAQPTEAAKIRCSMKMGCMQMSDSKAPVAGKNCIAVPRGWHHDRKASGVNKTGIKHGSFYRCY